MLVGSRLARGVLGTDLPRIRDHDQCGRAAIGFSRLTAPDTFTLSYRYAELQANSQIAGFGERPASRPSYRRVARHFIRYVMPLFDLRLRNRGALLSGP